MHNNSVEPEISDSLTKISFLGDIMCEAPLLKAAKKLGGYDFMGVFNGIRSLCEKSDFVVGNLETPLAGKAAGYTKDLYSFNTPDTFAEAAKNAGINLVLTANNHCCDRGIQGLIRTLDVLDGYGIPHVGTFKDAAANKPYYAKVNDTTFAFISCTASTNATRTKCEPTLENVNLLDEQSRKLRAGIKTKLKTFVVRNVLGEERYLDIRKRRGLTPKKATIDNSLNKDRVDYYLKNLDYQIHEAKRIADIVIVCPHMGGQFNVEPGVFSNYVMKHLCSMGADAVIASHPHVVQKIEIVDGVPCAYSLGNVSMSLSTSYIIRDNLPECGLMLHLYYLGTSLTKVTYTPIKIEENSTGYFQVFPMSEIYVTAKKKERTKLIEEFNRIARIVGGEFIFEEEHLPLEVLLWKADSEEVS